MRIGFIGAGKNARTMARHFLAAGHEVVLSNSRDPGSLRDVIRELGPGASAGTRDDVIATDLVILAVNWPDVPSALAGLRWTGQILIDATNAHSASPPNMSAEGVARSRAALGGRTSSEIVAELAPGARVVKSICNIPMAWIADTSATKPRTAFFVSGDDAAAKRVVVDLLDQMGFAGIDLGSLARGGELQELGGPLSAIEFHLGRRVTRKASSGSDT